MARQYSRSLDRLLQSIVHWQKKIVRPTELNQTSDTCQSSWIFHPRLAKKKSILLEKSRKTHPYYYPTHLSLPGNIKCNIERRKRSNSSNRIAKPESVSHSRRESLGACFIYHLPSHNICMYTPKNKKYQSIRNLFYGTHFSCLRNELYCIAPVNGY